MMKKTRGSQIKDLETGKIVKPVLIKDVMVSSQSWVKLALFLAGIPLSIIVLIVYALSFALPMGVSIPLGITVGLFLIVIYIDKLVVLLK